MKLGKNAAKISISPTVRAIDKVEKLLQQGKDVIRLDIGEPDFDTPNHIRQAGLEAIEHGFTHYTSPRGLPDLREAIGVDYRQKNVIFNGRNVVVFPGSKLALFAVLSLLIDQGDEVLVQDPVWPSYRLITEYLGGRAVEVPSGEEERFHPSVASFIEKITERTKAIIINNPCNPTGTVLPRKMVEDLLAVCDSKDVALISDEIYSPLFYGSSESVTPHCDIDQANLIVVNGFSKQFAMTGWRLGYTVAPSEFTDALVRFQENTTTCPASFVQKAAIEAMMGPRDWFDEIMERYSARRKIMLRGIERIEGWKCVPPEGAFYCFPSIANNHSATLADELLTQKSVSMVAGNHFGPRGEGHVRLAYTTSEEKIQRAMELIREFVAEARRENPVIG